MLTAFLLIARRLIGTLLVRIFCRVSAIELSFGLAFQEVGAFVCQFADVDITSLLPKRLLILHLYHNLLACSRPSYNLLTSLLKFCRAVGYAFCFSALDGHVCVGGSDRRRWTLQPLLRLHHLHIVRLLRLVRIHLALLGVFQIHCCVSSYRNGGLSRRCLSLKVRHVILHTIVMVPLQKIR